MQIKKKDRQKKRTGIYKKGDMGNIQIKIEVQINKHKQIKIERWQGTNKQKQNDKKK